MWGAIAVAVASCMAADAANKQQRLGQTYEDSQLMLRRQAITPGKCSSCGSRQFQHHNSVLICSYCRSPQ